MSEDNEGVRDLTKALRKANDMAGEKQHIILGDFNIHDPLWSNAGHPKPANNAQRADDLKSLIEQTPLSLATPRGLIARPAMAHRRNGDPQTTTTRQEPLPRTARGDAEPGDRACPSLGTTLDLCFTSWDLQN
ncbi:hypothetical protein ASPCADRAFT_510667 [Aspergillus carbonarius ITEM 5010]|uniref:Endonuclease/exonuclease/phosphatase domain-containing protein n=1 Tax=Aspergillus carbonarius (strain ITEM 5010) TaxID=602072 RepID=A0A1R3R829_ASPC5|nr:hypothetical protein ASPCADRAFT_510665 [Aspergillus carbonarius ITEM 5010]OOF90634.1 hypothetical protein ASPCADRAFT_510667 [Aspergillus carbonarius ITEM 5010]